MDVPSSSSSSSSHKGNGNANGRTRCSAVLCCAVLARVHIVCLDKTGTLTEGAIIFDAARPAATDTGSGWREVLGWFGVDANANANATARWLRIKFPAEAGERALTTVPFSSARKWSAVSFAVSTLRGSWVLAALSTPHDRARVLPVASMYVGLVGCLVVPFLQNFFSLELPPIDLWAVAVGAAIPGRMGVEIVYRIRNRRDRETTGA